jgi:hypothetical protein
MDGAIRREKTGAVGNELGQVENVAFTKIDLCVRGWMEPAR